MEKYNEDNRRQVVELSNNTLTNLHEVREFLENMQEVNELGMLEDGFMMGFLNYRFMENAAKQLKETNEHLKILSNYLKEIPEYINEKYNIPELINFMDNFDDAAVAELMNQGNVIDASKQIDNVYATLYAILDEFRYRY